MAFFRFSASRFNPDGSRNVTPGVDNRELDFGPGRLTTSGLAAYSSVAIEDGAVNLALTISGNWTGESTYVFAGTLSDTDAREDEVQIEGRVTNLSHTLHRVYVDGSRWAERWEISGIDVDPMPFKGEGEYTDPDRLSIASHLFRGADTIEGGKGWDDLYGFAGDDFILGGEGHDILVGGAGNDLLLGGSGDDTYVIENVGDAVRETTTSTSTLDAGGHSDRVETRVSFALPKYVEELILNGTGAIDGSGNILANYLQGNAAANAIAGGRGDDFITARGGGDRLTGGVGQDTLSGGEGADVYDYNGTHESRPGASDRINTFASGADRIDLSSIDANPFLAGNNAFTFIGLAAFSGDATGQVRYADVGANVIVYVSTDADADAEMQLTLHHGSHPLILSAADFIL